MAKISSHLRTVIAFSQLVILLPTLSYSVTAGFIPDSKHNNSEDLSNVVKEKISNDCASQGIVLPEAALEHYASCFKNSHIPLSFPIEDDLKAAVPGIRTMVDDMLSHWCLDWARRTACVRENIHHIEICLSSEKSILMDLNLAFGDALCSEEGGELFNVYMQFIEEGGIQCLAEREDITEGMMTCINPLNVARFNRNLFLVTDCIVKQLEQCPTEGPMELLNIMVEFSARFYKSTSTETGKLYKNDEDEDSKTITENEIIQIDDYVEIIPANAGTIYMYIYIGVAIGICMWVMLAIACHIGLDSCGQRRTEMQLKNQGWQKVYEDKHLAHI